MISNGLWGRGEVRNEVWDEKGNRRWELKMEIAMNIVEVGLVVGFGMKVDGKQKRLGTSDCELNEIQLLCVIHMLCAYIIDYCSNIIQ